MSQTSYPSASQPSRAKGKTQAAGVAVASAGKATKVAPAPAVDHMNGSVSSEAIAKRAYEKFVARGGAHGSDQEDWAAAERELIAESRLG
jgi:hypothetical protein